MVLMGFLWGWVRDWENTPATLDAMLDTAVAGGFRTVVYYVGCGTALYDSALLPSYGLAHDSLAYVVEQGHARGLKVEAWWCPGEAPKNATFRSWYPAWSVVSVEGIPSGAHWLNFSLPEVRQFVGDVVLEIAENYEVDGVHLDYIRYSSPLPWGPFDPADFFNADDVPRTVELCWQRLKAVRPEVLLTAAVMSSQGSSEGHLQNWADWLAGEYIDRVMPMAYYDPDETYAKPDGSGTLERDLGQWQALPHFEWIAPGLKVSYEDKTLKTPEQLIEQVEVCWEGGARDIAIFSSYGVTEEQLAALAKEFVMIGWYIAGYRRGGGMRVTRYCAMDDYTAEIQAGGGQWSESEVLGDRAIVKVRASAEILTVLDGVFTRLPKDRVADSLADLSVGERDGLVSEMLEMGYSEGEVTNLGDLAACSLGDVLDFMATRRLKPRYDAKTDQIVLDGEVQACRPVASVDAEVV